MDKVVTFLLSVVVVDDAAVVVVDVLVASPLPLVLDEKCANEDAR